MSKLMLSMVMAVAGVGAYLPDGQTSPPLRRFEYSQVHMGVAVRITLYTETEAKAESAAKAAYARIADLEQVMSDYRPTSEISQLCQNAIYGPVKISEDLYRVLRKSLDIAKETDGAFDPTVGPLVALWRDARRTGVLPTAEAIQVAKSRVGWKYVDLDDRTKTVFLRKHNLKVDFGGIAKGDACDQMIAVLKQKGIPDAMVEAGGDIKVSGHPPNSSGWLISILGSQRRMILKDMAISTSGDSEQFVEIGGKRYSHIVDPKTGLGLTSRIQATAIARQGLDTDPLATAYCVMGRRGSEKLRRQHGLTAIFVEAK